MAIRNQHWYTLNLQRKYPVDDAASALSDAGVLLPSGILADLRLRWPREAGKHAFITAVTSSAELVTVLFAATDDYSTGNDARLIAGITLRKAEVTAGRTYVLQPFYRGTAGFVAFGHLDLPAYSGTFKSPTQSGLTARAARYARKPPIAGVGIETAEKSLTGLINLVATPPLRIRKATRTIDGVEQDNVLVFSLIEPAAASSTNISVQQELAGPCGRRVGSRTCGDPQPIESINGVTPDCEGRITLEFTGCAVIGRNAVDCGVVVDCSVGLSQSCTPPYLPNLQTGVLPSETPPTIIRPPLPPQPPVVPPYSISESIQTLITLPYCDKFDEAVAYHFFPIADSEWGFVEDESPGESFCCEGPPETSENGCSVSSISAGGNLVIRPEVVFCYGTVDAAAQGRVNISLWPLDVQTLFRRYTTDFKIVAGLAGSQKNAGILLNYRIVTATLTTYVAAILDIDRSTFGIYYFNGITLLSLGQIAVPAARIDDWYRIQLSARPNPTNTTAVLLTARLLGVTDPTINVTTSTTLSTTLWVEDSGVAGLYARRSRSYFSFWRVDEVSD